MSKLAYNPGDVIQHDCKPFVKMMRREWKGARCDNCFKERLSTQLLHCSGCRTMHYCSSSCQRQDWKNGHKLECQSKAYYAFQMNPETDPTILRVFRLVALLKMKPSLANVKFVASFNGEERSLNDLRSMVTKEDEIEELESFPWVDVMEVFSNLDNLDISLRDFLECSYLHRKYSYIMYNEAESIVVGHGIFVVTAFVEHSCSPNAIFCCDGTTLRIRAIDHIQPGDAITICYNELLCKKDERQAFLLHTFKIQCQCRRCSSNVEEIDYDKLKRLMRQFSDSAHFVGNHRFSYFLALHYEIVELLIQFYSEYHDTVTSQYLRLFTLVKVYKDNISSKRLAHLVGKIRHQVEITFGEEHNIYKGFMKEVSVLKIKL